MSGRRKSKRETRTPATPSGPPVGMSPPPPSMPAVHPRSRRHEVETTEEVVARIVGMIVRSNLTLEQARKIAMMAAARASAPPQEITKAVHVMAVLDSATITRDEAKLIGIRAIRRAKHIEDRARIFGGPSE